MLGYRTFFHVRDPREKVIPLATGQLHAWLRERGYRADELRTGETVRLADGVEALLLEFDQQDGTRSLRARITENRRGDKWVSQLTVHVPRRQDNSWIWLDVESPDSVKWTDTPGLARNLLEAFPVAFDGEAELGPVPSRTTEEDAEALLDAVCDPDRRGLVILAGGNDDIPVTRWHDLVQDLVRDTVGLAATYVLDGPTTACFTELIGPDHAVAPGTVRTFLPAVDPADPQDALRHRVLGTRRIVGDDHQDLTRLLGWKARERALEAPLPKAAVRLAKLFDQRADELLLARLASASSVVVERRPAARAEESKAAVEDRIHELLDRIEKLQGDNQDLASRLEDEQLEHAAEVEDRMKVDRTVTYLRRELTSLGRGAAAWSMPADEEEGRWPGEFGELVGRLDELKFVEFTGDPGNARELDQHEQIGTWARKTWAALLVLDDYARLTSEGVCSRGVHGYLENPPDGGHTYPLNKHARDESIDVHNNDKFRAARVFPVPFAVNPAREEFMGAHFRIARSGMISPRMHYFDGTATTGRVYVGYVGRHLPTKRTN
ncbi:hypothetical protein [Actinophytocola oryzae]|uniref:Uncharacterized protein n=1 Tax=Actinophytocola oryzae TaxID=502181 RepID=A0A4R7VR51_9PSEU|nr:hypothetical protein [Actinophytocola oryzae]TDV52132.1 hypothetical protein CLV71_105263 [Actinophytocola oryzae]